jgi:hypothetical protein
MSNQNIESRVLSPDAKLFLGRPAANVFLDGKDKKPVFFSGSAIESPVPGCTYLDKGVLPLTPASFSMRYILPFLIVNVHFNSNGPSANCAIDASTTSVNLSPGFDMHNNRIDYLYHSIIEAVYIAKSDIVKKSKHDNDDAKIYAAILERYPNMPDVNFVESAFNRFVTLNMPNDEGGIARLLHLEQEIKDHYEGVRSTDYPIHSDAIALKRILNISPELKVNMQASNLGHSIMISSEAFYAREGFEDMLRFVEESKALEGKNLKVDYTNPQMFGVKWSIRMPAGGNHVLEEVFKDDLLQLRSYSAK